MIRRDPRPYHCRYALPVLTGLAVLLILAIVGTMDYRDAERAQDVYCEMVADGHWPDYNDNYDEVCRDE